jgi:hypothetical protein
MELIFEIIDPSGRSQQFRKLYDGRLRIGRAWDNDLILSDPAINPHHAVIEKDESGQLLITDLDSLNGTLLGRKQRINGSIALQAGEEYLLGKTKIQVYTPDFPVADTIKVADMDNTVRRLEDPGLLTAAALIVTLLYAGEQWLNMFSGFKWQEIANVLLFVYGGAIALTLFWVVVGRVLRHELQFRGQLTLILIFVAAQFLLSKLFALLMFNTLSVITSMAMLVVVEFSLLFALFWFNLYMATNQSNVQRTRTAMIIASAMIVLTLYTEVSVRSEFTDVPDYIRVLAPPALHFGGGVSEEEFLSGTAEVFSRLDEE